MPDAAVADRYAKALIELGQDNDLTETFAGDLKKLAGVLAHDELLAALSHPAFGLGERMKVLDEVLKQVPMHTHAANFARIVLEKGRFGNMRGIIAAYNKRADALAGRVRAVVTTATPLTPALEKEVAAALAATTKKTVHIESKVDPLIIGGVIAEVEGRIIDASLRTRMLKLRQSLLNASPDLVAEA